jgi:hypothetical protein
MKIRVREHCIQNLHTYIPHPIIYKSSSSGSTSATTRVLYEIPSKLSTRDYGANI